MRKVPKCNGIAMMHNTNNTINIHNPFDIFILIWYSCGDEILEFFNIELDSSTNQRMLIVNHTVSANELR